MSEEPQRKPVNTGVGSLSLLSRISPTKELNQVSCIAGGFFTNWPIREAPLKTAGDGMYSVFHNFTLSCVYVFVCVCDYLFLLLFSHLRLKHICAG